MYLQSLSFKMFFLSFLGGENLISLRFDIVIVVTFQSVTLCSLVKKITGVSGVCGQCFLLLWTARFSLYFFENVRFCQKFLNPLLCSTELLTMIKDHQAIPWTRRLATGPYSIPGQSM